MLHCKIHRRHPHRRSRGDRMKATDIVAFDVTEPLAITDAMLIASARTNARCSPSPRKSRRTCTSRPANASRAPAKA